MSESPESIFANVEHWIDAESELVTGHPEFRERMAVVLEEQAQAWDAIHDAAQSTEPPAPPVPEWAIRAAAMLASRLRDAADDSRRAYVREKRREQCTGKPDCPVHPDLRISHNPNFGFDR